MTNRHTLGHSDGPSDGRLVVAIPTTGRAEIVLEAVQQLAAQSRLPDLLILSVTGARDADISRLENLPFPVRIVTTTKGATRQRNRALSELTAADIVVFLDDDFLMAADYLARVAAIFAKRPDIAMATGVVLADGIGGRGFNHPEGAALLARLDDGARPMTRTDTYNGYGCNMALRMRPVIENNLEFDEDLPFYSWLEDLDFSRRLAAFGRIIQAGDLRGVHLGTKTGRTPGVMLGYSQISNPLYLVKKGTLMGWRAQRIIWRNALSNLLRAPRPEPWIDRRGRLRGNLLALGDLLRGRLSPQRIREF